MGHTRNAGTGQLEFDTTPSTASDFNALSDRVEEATTSSVPTFNELAGIGFPKLGQLVWVEAEALLYRRKADGWEKLVYDTDWLALGLAAGIGEQSGGPAVRRIGKEVSYKGFVKAVKADGSDASWAAGTSYSLLSVNYPLRADVRPKQAKYIPVAGNSGDSTCRSTTNSDGTMSIQIGTVIPTYVSLDAIHYPVV